MWRAHLVLLALILLPPFADRARASDIVIGVAAPLTGPKRATGEAVRSAVDDAAQAVNAKGGLLGAKLRVFVVDDGCQFGTAKTAALALIAEGARVIIGHPCSAAAVAAGPLYASHGTLFIATGARHPDLTAAPSPLTFRLAGRDDRQGEAAAAWLVGRAATRRFAIIHDRTAYAREIAESARRALLKSGPDDVPILTLVAGKPEYPKLVGDLRALGAEAVFFAGYPEEAAILLSNMRSEGLKLPLLGSDSLSTSDFAARIEAGQDVLVLIRREPDMMLPDRAIGLRATAAFEIWSHAVRSGGGVDAASTAQIMRSATFDTAPLGPISFDEHGNSREASFGIARPVGGKWELIE